MVAANSRLADVKSDTADQDAANIDMINNALYLVSLFDPTGIADVIAAFID